MFILWEYIKFYNWDCVLVLKKGNRLHIYEKGRSLLYTLDCVEGVTQYRLKNTVMKRICSESWIVDVVGRLANI